MKCKISKEYINKSLQGFYKTQHSLVLSCRLTKKEEGRRDFDFNSKRTMRAVRVLKTYIPHSTRQLVLCLVVQKFWVLRLF